MVDSFSFLILSKPVPLGKRVANMQKPNMVLEALEPFQASSWRNRSGVEWQTCEPHFSLWGLGRTKAWLEGYPWERLLVQKSTFQTPLQACHFISPGGEPPVGLET